MNDSNDFPSGSQANEVPRADGGTASETQTTAFCQNCGRGLTRESARVVGQAVFCEPCLEARVAGANPYMPVNPQGVGVFPGAPIPGVPNPALATLLGFIPGVGAMYNEQYAKGIVHLIVFVCLVTLTDSYGIFGLFVAGWEFYMAIDANHTARARRDGLPLPNPFGLNEIGERLGFGKNWGGTGATTAAPGSPAPPYAAPVYSAPPPMQPPAGAAPYTQPPPAPAWGAPAAYVPTWTADAGAGQGPTFAAPYPPVPPGPLSRFPSGAVWLIGLGSIFLLATTGLFEAFRTNAVIGLALIGLGIWLFLRRMSESGLGLESDGTPMYRYRVFRALRVSVWLVLIGLWLLLDAFRWVRLHHTWPLILIVAGVMSLLERLVFNTLPPVAPGAAAYPAAAWEPAPATVNPSDSSTPNDTTKGGI